MLGRAEGVEGYHDITRYPNAHQEPGLVLFRWDAPLFFANAELFKERPKCGGKFAYSGALARRCGRTGHKRRCNGG